MKVSLTMEIEYDTSGYADEADALADVQAVLHNSVNLMVANGGLSGSADACVESWEVHTDLVEG